MKTSYSFLRNAAFALKLIGYFGLIISAIIIILLFNPEHSLISFSLSISVIVIVLSSLLSLFITAALINLFCDIGDNTRITADTLKEQSELLKRKASEPIQSQNVQHNRYMPKGPDMSINDTFSR